MLKRFYAFQQTTIIIAYLYKKENKLYNKPMRKFFAIILCFSLIMLASCGQNKENTDTRILMNTVVTITADCSEETISRSFDLCTELEEKLSRTVNGSDIWEINNSDTFVEVGDEALYLINKALGFSRLSGGKFDITVYPVSSLYDFPSGKLPDSANISAALSLVDYRNIIIDGNKVCLKDGGIDLGGIAKGYVADRVVEFLKENGARQGTVNIGGNVYCFGEREFSVGIKKPFSNELAGIIKGKNITCVTSGIYERYISEQGKIYHHIIDPATGYGVENDLASVTVIGKCSADADALSTVCMLLGGEKAAEIIENTANTEAVLIYRDGSLGVTSGLENKNGIISIK